MSIIGIVLSLIAIGLIFYFKKDQQQTNDLTSGDVMALENGYNALMEDINNYQITTDRQIADLEKQIKIIDDKNNRRMDKMNKSLPSVIGQVVGQIEFAQDKINRQI